MENNTSSPQVEPSSPPIVKLGVKEWMRENLFQSWWSTLLTIAFTLLSLLLLKGTFQWVFFSAEWQVITENFKLLMVGQYPDDQLWRIWSCLLYFSFFIGLTWGIWKSTMGHVAISFGVVLIVLLFIPFITYVSKLWISFQILAIIAGFLIGNKFKKLKNYTLIGWVLLFPISMFFIEGYNILPSVGTNLWGGFLLTILIAAISIVLSFPLGILLALGRRSKLPIVKWFSIVYIELIRGIPLITVLFVAQLMLPLFLGSGLELDKVLRAMIGFTLFNAAYLAENVRGGLQSIPRGQFEAAQALGLNSTLMTIFIILPQALRAVIPAMVGQFISIFKDTVLVSIVGLIDLLGMAKKIIANPAFLGTQMESFVFVAFVFFLICYLMSYVSRRLETSLGLGER